MHCLVKMLQFRMVFKLKKKICSWNYISLGYIYISYCSKWFACGVTQRRWLFYHFFVRATVLQMSWLSYLLYLFVQLSPCHNLHIVHFQNARPKTNSANVKSLNFVISEFYHYPRLFSNAFVFSIIQRKVTVRGQLVVKWKFSSYVIFFYTTGWKPERIRSRAAISRQWTLLRPTSWWKITESYIHDDASNWNGREAQTSWKFRGAG